ncbi:hypothetical protein G6F22_022141 [Rhizopus arrhizus]|nr:hypothetical protein G6F22_022141 [Rhizopus arrhizus]
MQTQQGFATSFCTWSYANTQPAEAVPLPATDPRIEHRVPRMRAPDITDTPDDISHHPTSIERPQATKSI